MTLSQPLDREAADWHNVTVVAKETSKEETSSVLFRAALIMQDGLEAI